MTTSNLFDKPKVTKKNPRRTYKFGDLSLYYDGRYYFPGDIQETENLKRKEIRDEIDTYHNNKIQRWIDEGLEYSTQVVYYEGKWKQDTHYITKEFKEFLESFV